MPTIAQLEIDIKRIWRHSFQAELDTALEHQLRTQALAGVQAALEAALVEELLAARAAALESTGGTLAQFYRSGAFTRRVLTRFGTITALHIPKLRQGTAERDWQILRRYQQAMPRVLDTMCYFYTLGLSLRDLQEGRFLML